MQMSQVLADIGAGAHTTPLPSHGACGGQRYLSGRNRLEESPQAAVALKGDVPILASRCIVAAAFTAACCAATEWAFPPMSNLPSCPPWIIARSACGGSSWRSWRLCERCFLARDPALRYSARDVSLAERPHGEFHAKTPSRKEVFLRFSVLGSLRETNTSRRSDAKPR